MPGQGQAVVTDNPGHQQLFGGGYGDKSGQNWIFGTGNLNNMNNQLPAADNKNGPGSGGLQTLNNAQVNFRNDRTVSWRLR